MNAKEMMEQLFTWASDGDFSNTCDTCNAGDPTRTVHKVGVTMFPTMDVLQQAAAWGADLLIVHEPLYFQGRDQHSDHPIEVQKRAYVESTGMTIWRYHDHAHAMREDLIAQGFFHKLALPGSIHYPTDFDLARLLPQEPITPRALAKLIQDRLGIRHVRLCGALDTPCTVISTLLGASGPAVLRELKKADSQIVIAGEVCEWADGEFARDAAAMGHTKALLILGHVGSERDGMSRMAEIMRTEFPDQEIRYFQCNEVFSYVE